MNTTNKNIFHVQCSVWLTDVKIYLKKQGNVVLMFSESNPYNYTLLQLQCHLMANNGFAARKKEKEIHRHPKPSGVLCLSTGRWKCYFRKLWNGNYVKFWPEKQAKVSYPHWRLNPASLLHMLQIWLLLPQTRYSSSGPSPSSPPGPQSARK